jgi:hypothetical protein
MEKQYQKDKLKWLPKIQIKLNYRHKVITLKEQRQNGVISAL